MKKVIYLLKNFNFGTLKVVKTCLVIRFLAVICPGIRFFLGNFAWTRFCTCHTSIPTFIRESPPPPLPTFIQLLHECWTKIHVFTNTTCFNSYMTLNNCPSIVYYLDEKKAFVSSIKTCTQVHTPDNKPRWNLTDLLYFNGQFQPWCNLTPLLRD